MPSVTRTVLPAVSAAKFSRVLCSIMPWSVMSRKEEECGWKRAKVAFGKRHLVRVRARVRGRLREATPAGLGVVESAA